MHFTPEQLQIAMVQILNGNKPPEPKPSKPLITVPPDNNYAPPVIDLDELEFEDDIQPEPTPQVTVAPEAKSDAPSPMLVGLDPDLKECLQYCVNKMGMKLWTPETVFIQQLMRNIVFLGEKIDMLERKQETAPTPSELKFINDAKESNAQEDQETSTPPPKSLPRGRRPTKKKQGNAGKQ